MRHKVVCFVLVVFALSLLDACGGGGGNGDTSGNNSAPIANAGPDQTRNILAGDIVVLDGSASSDADGDTLSDTWTLITEPATSAATLSNPSSERPTFDADVAGTYVARLVVNDGKTDSAADEVTVLVMVPPPTVTISTPAQGSILTSNPVTIGGTVSDPAAVVTVNGTPAPTSKDTYSIDLTLAEGPNTIAVVATNGTGDGTAEVDVVLNTLPGPTIDILSQKDGFFVGYAWLGQGAAPTDAIPTTVSGVAETAFGPPTVTINGVAATVTQIGSTTGYAFEAPILLSKGTQTLAVTGYDNRGARTDVSLSGEADYCHVGASDAGILAVRGDGQNDRCHEIDGCNRNKFGLVGSTDTNSLRNLPMPNTIYNQNGPIQFGSGYIMAIGTIDLRNDYFVHGQIPRDTLGCNFHDACYQTCVQGNAAKASAYSACNLQQYDNHVAECRRHYPPTCPYVITVLGKDIPDPIKCPLWANEKQTCWNIADLYWRGVSSGSGWDQYLVRQNDYCASP